MGAVAIKGTPEGIAIILRGERADIALQELEAILNSSVPLLEGNKIILEMKMPALGVDELGKVLEILKSHGLSVEKIVSDAESVRKAAYALGLKSERSYGVKPDFALVKRGPIRSGQKVSYEGSIVIIGDVNPGGEVIAGGDIMVWGSLKGIVFAGAPDDHSRRIYALRMEPSLIKIGPYIARPPEGARGGPLKPEVAFVQEGKIVVEELS